MTAGDRLLNAADSRFRVATTLRPRMNKVFPEHFSFLFGELALYSLVVLVFSGVYLAMFFEPSMSESPYSGSYTYMQGLWVSRAYETTLNLSFDVRGGLLARQVHHWAALVFTAAIITHMCRIFFSGAYRKPRETNWVIGVMLLLLVVFEGFFGYSMPDDLLSGQGVRIMSGIILSVPVIGTWMSWMTFGGEYAGDIILLRFFTIHVFIIPALIFLLLAVHLASVWYQQHTQFPGSKSQESNVVGTRVMPSFAMKSTGLATAVTALLIGLGGLFQINPVWNYGPYVASHSSLNAQPDWYLLFIEGALRLFPPWHISLGPYTVVPAFWPSVFMPGVMFALLFAYPFLEQRLTKDYRQHNLLQRPRDAPVRTAVGVMALSFWVILVLAGSDDVIALVLRMPIEPMVWTLQMTVLSVPPLGFLVTYVICRRLQHSDRDVLESGVRTGILQRHPDGYYVEVRQRLHAETEDGATVLPRYANSRLPTLPGELKSQPDKDNQEHGEAQRRDSAVPKDG